MAKTKDQLLREFMEYKSRPKEVAAETQVPTRQPYIKWIKSIQDAEDRQDFEFTGSLLDFYDELAELAESIGCWSFICLNEAGHICIWRGDRG